MLVKILQAIFVFIILMSAYVIIREYRRNEKEDVSTKNRIIFAGFSFIANIVDTLGIGSFATTTAFCHATKLVDDKKIPGTLVVGCTIPVAIQALAFTTTVTMDPVVLVIMLLCSAAGAFIGGKLNGKLPVRTIRITMGIGLFIAGFLILGQIFDLLPGGGNATTVTGIKLVVGCVVIFILGLFYPLGIGCYAPTMVLVSLIGMNPTIAFPVMMGGATFNNLSSFFGIIKSGNYHRVASLDFDWAGAIAVIIAVKFITSLPIGILRWIVFAVVIYTAASMLHAAFKQTKVEGVNAPATEL